MSEEQVPYEAGEVPGWAKKRATDLFLSAGGPSPEEVARLFFHMRVTAIREAARLSKGPFAKAIYGLIDKEPTF